MKRLTQKIVCILLAVVATISLALAGCGGDGNKAHVCESKCPKCGYCLNKECKEPACELKCPGHKDEKATIKSVEITVSPKTDYYPGEIFNPSGLVVKATLSSGKTKTIFDEEFTTWTHKNEPLTKDIDKITFTVPGYDFTFDLPITVSLPTDITITVDTSALKEKYTTDETIDFSAITVRVANGNTTSVLEENQWKLFNGTTEITDKTAVAAKDLGVGEITLTAQYLPEVYKNFTVTIVDAAKAISPAFIEAEDCVYKLSGVDKNSESSLLGTETDTPYTTMEKTAIAEYFKEDGTKMQSSRISNGASGRGAVSSLTDQLNGKTVYFKFKVTVPETGNYKIKARAQSTNGNNVKNNLAVNINGKKGSDGKLEFTLNNKDQFVALGNQLSKYCDLKGNTYTRWFNMYWWGVLDIGTFEMTKGENEIRIYLPTGFPGNIDYFEVVENDEPEEAKIMSMRSGARVDLSKNILYLEKGKKLTDIVLTPELHPAKYTLLYLRTSDGKEIPVLESMLEGKIDYEKLGEQTVTVTDPVSGESASFTLVIEELQSDF